MGLGEGDNLITRKWPHMQMVSPTMATKLKMVNSGRKKINNNKKIK